MIRLSEARQALRTLQELSDLARPSEVERDAAIQRFEYTFEAIWKSAQAVLAREGFTADSPRSAIRHCRSLAILDDVQAVAALKMMEDRNLTVHTYKRDLAVAIYDRLAEYARLLDAWLAGMDRRMAQR